MKTKQLSEEQLAVLNEAYPVSDDVSRLSLPRMGMLSKDIVETTGTGKNKRIRVIQSSGTFFTEKDEGEVDEEGKKAWSKKFIDGDSIDGVIVFHRYQLRRYDSSLEKFYSTPIYDNPSQVLPLYLDRQAVKRGTEGELQALYPKLSQKGRKISDLKKYTILYVIYEGELYQMNLSATSGWSFDGYKRKGNPSAVVTTIGSSEETFGDNTYRKATFATSRPIGSDEFDMVVEKQALLKEQVRSDERFYIAAPINNDDKQFAELTESATKALED